LRTPSKVKSKMEERGRRNPKRKTKSKILDKKGGMICTHDNNEWRSHQRLMLQNKDKNTRKNK
jgi:hypothetical protein